MTENKDAGKDIEQQAGSGTAAAAQGTPFKRFMSGPYFKVIPPAYEKLHRARTAARSEAARAAAAGGAAEPAVDSPKAAAGQGDAPPADEGEDYLGRLKRIVMNDVDTDGVYGLTDDELVPLPFDVPKWHAYLVDILSGVYLVAQATIVMFIGIYTESQDRTWKEGEKYTSHWLPLIKALIVIYPLFTLLILVSYTVEYCIRKFMYFRLLSMRILVDWANKQLWHAAFFYYFIATWILMNVWAIYGVARYYNKNGNKGVDSVSFGTFVLVNLQTMQLFIYYTKLLSTENRLVSLNQIFERAPVEAQRLLEFTYVIEEADLIDECLRFANRTDRNFWKRLVNMATCCMAARDWNMGRDSLKFDIERLKRRAGNYHQVEQNVAELKAEVLAEEGRSRGEAGDKGAAAAPDQVQLSLHEPNSPPGHSVMANAAGSPKALSPEAAAAAEAEEKAEAEADARAARGWFFGWSLNRFLYQRMYASLHSLRVSIMVRNHSWPYRHDVPYFRMLTLAEIIGLVSVGAIVVLGWKVSTGQTTCAKSAKTCNTCLSVHERYFSSAEPLCAAMEVAVAKIVASTNGTWLNPLSGRQEERYCGWNCAGNFSMPQTCTP